ncbi:MAG: TPM domain-containing protein [Bacteroidales bacterium]|nr:TPM domain-containing protein [Bacteroidales bacterium]
MKKLLSLFVSLLFSTLLFPQTDQFPAKPSPPRLVNDFAAVMSPDQVYELENMLVAYNDSTSTQIAVVTVTDLMGYDIADYANQLATNWKIGQKGDDNGILILLKPKIGNEKGYARVEVGYGLEDVIPDAIARRIVDNEMIPYFSKGDYAGGIKAAAIVVMDLSSGKYKADDYGKGNGWIGLLPIILIILVAIFFRGSSNRYHAGGSSLPFWTTLFLLNSMGHGGQGGQWKDFSSGGGMFGGGGGGGGFGGFGGGGFGGGGASGSW